MLLLPLACVCQKNFCRGRRSVLWLGLGAVVGRPEQSGQANGM